MTDTARLKKAIEESGLKMTFIADRLGISRQALGMKIAGLTEFKASEIVIMRSILGLSPQDADQIFLVDHAKGETL